MKRRTCSHGEGEGDGGRQESMLKRGGNYTKGTANIKAKLIYSVCIYSNLVTAQK